MSATDLANLWLLDKYFCQGPIRIRTRMHLPGYLSLRIVAFVARVGGWCCLLAPGKMPAVAVLTGIDAECDSLFFAQNIGSALRLLLVAIRVFCSAICAGTGRAAGAGRLPIFRCQMPLATGLTWVGNQPATISSSGVVGSLLGFPLGRVLGQRFAGDLADTRFAFHYPSCRPAARRTVSCTVNSWSNERSGCFSPRISATKARRLST